MELATTIVGKSTIAYHLHRSKTGTELLFAPSCHRLPHKNYISCLSFSTTVYITITIYRPPETSENVRFCILMAVSSWYSKH